MEANEILALINEITPQLKASLKDWYGTGAVLMDSPEIKPRDWSVFIRYNVQVDQDKRKAILVKIRRRPDESIMASIRDIKLVNEGRDDFKALQAIAGFFTETVKTTNNKFQTNQGSFKKEEMEFYTSIRPLVFYERWSALVMEELEARQLREFLLDMRMSFQTSRHKQLEMFLFRTGRWLRVYHEQLGQLHDGAFYNDNIHGIIQKNLQMIESASGMDFEQLRSILDKAREKRRDQSIAHGLLHWNFDCANVLISTDDRVCILDSHFIDGPIYVDITKIMTDLQTYIFQTLSQGLFIRADQMKRFHQSILRGYFGEEQPDTTALNLYGIFSILEKWQTDEETLQDKIEKKETSRYFYQAFAGWRRIYFKKLISSHLRQLAVDVS